MSGSATMTPARTICGSITSGTAAVALSSVLARAEMISPRVTPPQAARTVMLKWVHVLPPPRNSPTTASMSAHCAAALSASGRNLVGPSAPRARPNTVCRSASHSHLIPCVYHEPKYQGGCDEDAPRTVFVAGRGSRPGLGPPAPAGAGYRTRVRPTSLGGD